MKNQTDIKVNDVVQFTKGHVWWGCLGIVEKDKGKGHPRRFMIGVEIPKSGTAYIFDSGENIERIGVAAYIHDKSGE